MASFKSIQLSAIAIGERARPIDEDHASAIAASLVDRGLINPITVRPTPAAKGGKTPYTLVAGGHRLRAAQINGWEEIDAIVVSVDVAEAQLMELSENLYRNDLSPLDRAVFVLKFREIYEEKHGKVNPNGGRPKKQDQDEPVFSGGRKLSDRVCERLGFSASSYKRVTAIGQKLHPALRIAVRGTPAEDDQSMLLKLAKMPADDQFKLAAALREGADLKSALGWAKPAKPIIDEQEEIFRKVTGLFNKADAVTLRRIVDHIDEHYDLSDLEEAA